MENKYLETKERHQKEFNAFPIMFAFSNKQFEEGMKKLGLKASDTDKIYRFGSTGGYYKREDAKDLRDMLDRHNKEMQEGLEDDQFLKQAFEYELANHEYCVTYDVTDTLSALGMTEEEAYSNPKIAKILNQAQMDTLRRSEAS